MLPQGLEPTNKNIGNGEQSDRSGPFRGPFLPWSELREAIQHCPDLPQAARERLIAEGDAAVSDQQVF